MSYPPACVCTEGTTSIQSFLCAGMLLAVVLRSEPNVWMSPVVLLVQMSSVCVRAALHHDFIRFISDLLSEAVYDFLWLIFS